MSATTNAFLARNRNPSSRGLRWAVAVPVAVSCILVMISQGMSLWVTPDQHGQWLFQKEQFVSAAQAFSDPMWRGTALYRAGEFEDAAQMFARIDTAEGQYNQGNAWLMHGQYDDAIRCFESALSKRPDWQDAVDNKLLAEARAKMLSAEGGEMGDQRLGADEIVFDRNDKKGGQDTEVKGQDTMSDQQMQAIWLRRVQTKPADFLKSKFAYQQAVKQEASE